MDSPPAFDQRPGSFEATRAVAEGALVPLMARRPDGAWMVCLLGAGDPMFISPDMAHALALNLLELAAACMQQENPG